MKSTNREPKPTLRFYAAPRLQPLGLMEAVTRKSGPGTDGRLLDPKGG